MTIADAVRSNTSEDHERVVHAWAQQAWADWAEPDDRVRDGIKAIQLG